MTFLLIALFALLLSRDLPKLIRAKQKKDIAVYCVFIAIAFTVALLQGLNVDIFSPIKALRYFMSEILHVRLENLK